MEHIQQTVGFNKHARYRMMRRSAIAFAAIFLSACAYSPCTCDPIPALAKRAAILDFSSCKRPEWPKAELAARHLGTVTFEFLVDVDGKVKDSIITATTGYPILDDTARAALIQCSFTPATKNGIPVMDWTEVKFGWAMH